MQDHNNYEEVIKKGNTELEKSPLLIQISVAHRKTKLSYVKWL